MRRFVYAAAFAACFLVAGPASAGSGRITIFHTNDLHSQYLPERVGRGAEETMLGGFAALDATLRSERKAAEASLYLDAGDFMTGTPLADIEYEGARGGAIVTYFNLLDLDASTLGNHEFDQTLENLDALLALAKYPVLAANLHRPDGTLFTGKAYEVFDVGGVRVGVIGLTVDDLNSLTGAEKRKGFVIEPGVEALRALVPEVDAKSDLVVVVSHEGIEIDRAIAGAVEGIDVIVGGHSHTRIDKGERVGGVLILQAGDTGKYLGRADLVVAGDSVTSAECRLVPVRAEADAASPAVAGLITLFQERIDDEYGAVIAQAPADLGRCYFCESDLGNWVADRLREATGADVAFINSGGLRKDITAGPVTKLDIFEVLPFWNQVCTFTCTGEELRTIALTNSKAEAEESHGILEISGLTYSWWGSPDGVKLHNAMVGGAVVDPARVYKVASVDFIAISNAEKYLGISPKDAEPLGMTLTSIVMDAAEKIGIIRAPAEDRILRVEIDFMAPPRR
jgi:2',3'-cyclic-nucleotide 2'-phosphodiesterase (5'-nucleotidase family)